MPYSLFNNLATSFQEAEDLVATKRSRLARLKARYDSHSACAPTRSTRLNQLARSSDDLVKRKSECRKRIMEEQQRLKDYEASRTAIAHELRLLEMEAATGAELKTQVLELQDEIVAVDDELQTFKHLARKIEWRARQSTDTRKHDFRKSKCSVPDTSQLQITASPPIQKQAGVEVCVPLRRPIQCASVVKTPEPASTITVATRIQSPRQTLEPEVLAERTNMTRLARSCVLVPSIEPK